VGDLHTLSTLQNRLDPLQKGPAVVALTARQSKLRANVTKNRSAAFSIAISLPDRFQQIALRIALKFHYLPL
jgi:hypothetical protein